jgi:hypothetical protein
MIWKDLTKTPSTDPSNLLRLRDGVYAADLLITAAGHLNFFSRLDDSAADFDDICSSFQIERRPADVMITLFKSLDLLTEIDGRYHLTKLAQEYLTDSSPWSLRPYISPMHERQSCHDLLDVLRTGKPSGWGANMDDKEWSQVLENEFFAKFLTTNMDSRGTCLAPALAKAVDLSQHARLLDIAGGSGIYSAAIVSENSHIRASVLEKKAVGKITRTFLDERGVSEKVMVIAGDMFEEELPRGYDAHLFSNTLHDWDMSDVKRLLENSHRNLDRNGMVIIHDAHINAEKNGPLPVAEYSVLLMFWTRGKCYSISEVELLLKETGFSEIRFMPTVAHRSVITAIKAD